MKLTREDVFEYVMTGNAFATLACFVGILAVLVLSIFGICEPIDQIAVHSISLLIIQFLILCVMHDVRERDRNVWDRLNRMRKEFEALGLINTTKSNESPFLKNSFQGTSSLSKDSAGETAQ